MVMWSQQGGAVADRIPDEVLNASRGLKNRHFFARRHKIKHLTVPL